MERLDYLANLTAFVNSKKSARPSRFPKSYRYPRPLPPRRLKPASIDEIRRFFGRR